MAVVDAVRVIFDAEWRGNAAIRQLEADLARVSGTADGSADKIARAYDAAFSTNTATNIIGGRTGVAAVQIQALENALGSLIAKQRALGAEVNKGNLSIGQAGGMWNDYQAEINKIAPALETARQALVSTEQTSRTVGQSIGDFVNKYRTLVFSLTAIGASIGGTIAALKGLSDFTEQGASVRQLTASFNALNESVLGTPNLLNDMKEAARGTVSDLSLMESFLTLVAGTSEELSQQFARTAPQLLEIAKAANVLNPALGNTQFFFESLARGIKRGEIRLLDNLGIIVKVGEANKAYAQQLGVTVEALSAEERQIALLNEVLRVGDNLINQVGGSTASLVDPYQQVAAATENWRNALASLVSISFGPTSDTAAMLNQSTRGLQQAVTDLETYKAALIEIIAVARDSSGDLISIRERLEEISDIDPPGFGGKALEANALRALALESITTATTVEGAVGQIGKAFGAVATEIRGGEAIIVVEINGIRQAIAVPTAQIVELIDQRADETSAAWANYWAAVAEGQIGTGTGAPDDFDDEELRKRTEAWLASQEQQARELQGIQNKGKIALSRDRELQEMRDQMAASYKEDAAEMREAQALWLEAVREIATAVDTNIAAPVIEFATGDGTSDYIVGNIRDLGEAWITTTNATEDQRYALEQWKKEASSLEDQIRDLELGIGTYGKETDDVTESLADARGELEFYRAKIAEVEGQLASTTEKVNRGLNINDEFVSQSLVDSLEGLGASSGVIVGVAQELGLLSSEAAEAALKIGFVKAAVDLLASDIVAGNVSPRTAADVIEQIIGDIEGGLSLEEIEANVNVRVNANVQSTRVVQRQLADFETDVESQVIVGANASAADNALARIFGAIDEAQEIVVEANTESAQSAIDVLSENIESRTRIMKVDVTYNDPGAPAGSGGGGGGGGGGSDTGTSPYNPASYEPIGPAVTPVEIIDIPEGGTSLGGGTNLGGSQDPDYHNITINIYNYGSEPDQSSTTPQVPTRSVIEILGAELSKVGIE